MSKPGSRKVEAGEVDATLLAAAGLKRLEIDAGTAIPTEIILPAPGQAVIGIECRTNDTRTQSVLTTVNNQITYACVMAERAFTRALGGTCASPVAAFCVLEDGDLQDARRSCSARTAARWSRSARCSIAAITRRPERSRDALLAKAPESIRRLFAAQ